MCSASDVYLDFIAGINTDRSNVWALLAYIIAFGEDNSISYNHSVVLSSEGPSFPTFRASWIFGLKFYMPPYWAMQCLCKRDVNWSMFKIIIPYNDLEHYKKICTSNVTIKLGIWVPEFGGLWRDRYTQPYDTTGILSLSVHRITQLLSGS